MNQIDNKSYNVEIESLNKLLEEAQADEELTKLAVGTEEKKPEEEKVEEVNPIKTVASDVDVEPVKADDHANIEVENPTETKQEGEDVEPVPNVDAPKYTIKDLEKAEDKEEECKDEKCEVKEELELGTEDKEPEEEKVEEPENPTETKQEGEDIKPVPNDDACKDEKPAEEEKVEDKKEEHKDEKPAEEEKVEDKKEEHPEDDKDKKLEEALEHLNAIIMSLNEEDHEVEVKLGVEDREPEEEKVEDADPTETKQEGEDIKPVPNDDACKEEKPAEEEKADDKKEECKDEKCEVKEELELGAEDKKPEEEKVEVADPTETVASSVDVEPVKTDDHADIEVTDPTETVQDGEDVEPVPNDDACHKKVDLSELEKEDKCDCGKEECEECKKEEEKADYHSVKEAIKAGTKRFESDEDKKKLEEQIAILLASENNDLLYEEYSRLVSEAKSLKESIIKKYSIIANNRTNSLLESMEAMEARIANSKNMFKKLNEQQEINAAKQKAKVMTPEEVAFTNEIETDK